MIGKSIEETEIRQKYRLNIIAIENGDETNIEVIPDYRLRRDDIIVVIGKQTTLLHLQMKFKDRRKRAWN